MATEYKLNTGEARARVYSGFGGLLRDASDVEPPYRMNVYRDYSAGGEALESIPGFRKIAEVTGEITDLHAVTVGGERMLAVHAGSTPWLVPCGGGASRRLTGALTPVRGTLIPDGEDF
jgi:hypothetical protein